MWLMLVIIILVAAFIRLLLKDAIRQATRKPLDIPEGNHQVIVYTYDGRPIQRLRPDDCFGIEFVEGVTSMTSIYTGGEWDGECGVKANGKQIGYLGDSDLRFNYVSMLMRYYKPIKAHARIKRYSNQGWPYVVVDMPDQSWFVERIKEAEKR